MTRQENERKCYSLEEVMVMLDVCRNTLMKLIRGNEFPYFEDWWSISYSERKF